MSLKEILTADMRLYILRSLREDPGYSLNDSILQSALVLVGHDVARDRVRTELHWLAEQGLVTLVETGPFLVAKLTQRGVDCSLGRATVPGVKRPGPED